MTRYLWIIPLVLASGFLPVTRPAKQVVDIPAPEAPLEQVAQFEICNDDDLLFEPKVYREGWHLLPQPRFWTTVLRLSPDSCVASVAETRQVIGFFLTEPYEKLTAPQKEAFKDSLKRIHNLPKDTRIYLTYGKRHYYLLREAMPSIREALPVFRAQNTDPWYAQAILLIESPGMNHRSTAGAYGGFQLLKSVAVKYGLKVNAQEDEREDIARSAYAAARFISGVCIPEARRMVSSYGIVADETSMWFRLLVMHVYHAGAGNVRSALEAIQPNSGGMGLITQLWRTESRGFKNASQNYTQIALACWVELDRILGRYPFEIQPVNPPASLPAPNLYKVN